MICTFFGHRDTPDTVRPLLREVLLDLIEHHGIKQFYVGNQGNFDAMALRLLKGFEKPYHKKDCIPTVKCLQSSFFRDFFYSPS